jgi:predicted NACHT family NTPase
MEQKLLENPRVDSVAIDYKDKQAMLRQVAYHMQAADKGLAGNLIRGDDLEKILIGYLKSIEVNQARTVARLLIEQLRSRNFILCYVGADSYAFVHRTFLEYFCACEFVERFGKRGLEGGLTIEELKTEVFGKHWQDESWHEVLRLIAGMIDTSFAGEIIDYLMAQDGEAEKFINLFLAAKCLSDVRNRIAITPISNQLFRCIESLTNKNDSVVRRAAVQTLAKWWKDDSDTLPWLKSRTRYGYWDVCRTAIQELARGWKNDPDTLPWLKSFAQSLAHSVVRQAAMQELVKGWKDDSDTLPLLKSLAQSDNDPAVRQAAVQELAKGWKDDVETITLLKSLAQSDDNKNVRRAAEIAIRGLEG